MGKALDLRAPDEERERVGVGLSKAGLRSSSVEEDKFVTEWSYYVGDDEAEDNSARGR